MELSDIVLRNISCNLGSEWEKLASYLGFSQAKIEQFIMEGTVRGIENAMFSMLVAWRETQPVQTTNYRKELKSALEKCGRSDLADLIHEDSPKAQLDAIYSSLCCKLENKPELFEDAINAFYTGYVSMTTDSDVAAALVNFGQSAGDKENKEDTGPRRKWKQNKKISKRGPECKAFEAARAITLNESGDIAVVDEIVYDEPQECGNGSVYFRDRPRVYVFGNDGCEKFVLNSAGDHEEPRGILKCGSDVAVTKQGHFAVTDNTTDVKLFDVKGQHIGSFSTSDDSSRKQKNRARCIAANSNGELYVGDFSEQVVTVHDADNFQILRDIPVSINPSHIAVNSQGHVCVVHTPFADRKPAWHNRRCKVIVVDESGDELFTLSPSVWGKLAIPLGVVFDADDTLLLAVLDRSIKNGGHVHRYGKKGEFLECIIKGREEPSGIDLKNDALVIADRNSVMIYKSE